MIHLLRTTFVFAIFLSGCGQQEPAKAIQQKDASKMGKVEALLQPVPVPDADIPTDGTVHVVKSGKFVIKPDTLFCTYRPGFGLDESLNNALIAIGQSDYLNGSPRTDAIGPEGDPKACITGNHIMIRGIQSANRTGKPYRLTLIVRQGDAFWQGILERRDGLRSEHVDIASEDPVNLKSYSKASLARDMRDLSREFAIFVTGKKIK